MKRRILKFSSFVILIMCFVLLSSTNVFASEEIEDEYLFETINLETREIEIVDTPKDVIEKLEAMNNVQTNISEDSDSRANGLPRRVQVGKHDERKKVENTTIYPYCTIAYIEAYWKNGDVTMGTAFMTSPKRALTAGHNLYDASRGGYPKSVIVWPGKNGFGIWNNPYGDKTVYADKLVIPKVYRSASDAAYASNSINDEGSYYTNEMKQEDWGVIRFDEELGNQTQYLDLRCYDPETSFAQKYCYLSGYPHEYRYYQYMAGSTIRSNDSKVICHCIDMSKGQSGAPIYEIDNDGSIHVIAINTSEDIDKTLFTKYNYGRRIDYVVQYHASFPN